jgi:hypothetical protein
VVADATRGGRTTTACRSPVPPSGKGDLQCRLEERRDSFIRHFEDWSYDWLDVPAMLRGADAIFEYPMIMEFASVEALRSYQRDPRHLAVMAFNDPFVAHLASVDFTRAEGGAVDGVWREQ